VRELLKMYLDERVLFYTTRDWARLAKINSDTAKLQNELWAAVRPAATVRTTSIVVSLVISGERRAELARIYASGVVESHPHCGAGADGGHRHPL